MHDHLEKYTNLVFQIEKYVTEICSVIQDFAIRFYDFQKLRTVVQYSSFPFKSDLNIKETAAAICENYSLNKPSLEHEILILKNYIFIMILAGQECFES
jgi:hypothetical protein